MRLENKSIVVTGASSGMGKAIVELFVKEGANVIAVARRKERLDALAESLKDEAGKVVTFVGDVSDRAVNEAMIDLAVKEFGKLDVLINNAGVMDDMAPIAEVTDEMYQKVMNINLYGPMCAMRKAVSVFLEQGNGGSIVNVSSVGAEKSCAGPIYCASKAALNRMALNVAYTYMNEKIRCNVIAPGGIITEISSSMGIPNANGYSRMGKIFAAAPAPGSAMEIAQTALFLASDDSSYVSGDIIHVDGGWCAG